MGIVFSSIWFAITLVGAANIRSFLQEKKEKPSSIV